ncbi:hypothetical protein RJ639_004175 [Escallonia herrerae]|uniref:CCHC-type domain-containing protein n=1 Tax=Escallonia herrerae TaxID=1293975 RepID=A0AA89AUY9_9ASTE|nr:hypothetical protein RJ639_004175 [Escallonia herrerae]
MAQGRSTDHSWSRNKGRSRSQSKAIKLKCYHCHKEGHYRKDCPERKGKKNDNSKTADAGVIEDNFDGADLLSVTISPSDGGWIPDTGCSYHMCPNRDWFAIYRSFDGGKVLMGKDVTCKVACGVMRIMKGDLVVMKGFLISRDVTFDESLMLSNKEELINVRKDHGAREKVELEV